ncbi:MAG: cytochrome c oxidase accessory protein CcoG [Bdellovibrio sp. CG10_big_fil_rev_8_21_14_0_10_47_8]|nr:MAG: cytochrome c oxidase accessory protein CcoG [Bdellovibrio sp. CG10_big_fil_rev_8_21_14_0_10_47_8]
MNKDQRTEDHLGMLDEYGHRLFIIPAEIRGFFQRRKKIVHVFLLIVFLLLPWIHLGGHQAIWVDIPGRHFTFFGLSLYAHDAPLIFFVLMILTLSLALLTALVGRAWCGWACPQTVFIETIYRQIETWIEGNYIARRKLRDQDLDLRKIRLGLTKWAAYFVVSSLIAHSFVAYFVGSKNLLTMIEGSPEQNMSYFVFVSLMTLVLMFNFGWFREQFCLIMCPYGRFQSVLMDSHSLTVMYDEKRGEPRKGQWQEGQEKGDCVSCQRCVQVCPTGIDIRNGTQFECIACTACIDACDEIMEKVHKPKGLIRYKALTEKKIQWFRSRVLSYGGLLLISVIALIVLLSVNKPYRIEVLRGKDAPYTIVPMWGKNVVQNHFDVRFESHSQEELQVQIEIDGPLANQFQMIVPENPMRVVAGEKRNLPIFIQAPETIFSGLTQIPLDIRFTELKSGEVLLKKTITFVGPAK